MNMNSTFIVIDSRNTHESLFAELTFSVRCNLSRVSPVSHLSHTNFHRIPSDPMVFSVFGGVRFQFQKTQHHRCTLKTLHARKMSGCGTINFRFHVHICTVMNQLIRNDLRLRKGREMKRRTTRLVRSVGIRAVLKKRSYHWFWTSNRCQMKRCEFRVILNVKYFTWRIELQQHLQHVRASRRCGGVKNRSSVGGITYGYWWTLRQNLSQCNHIIPFNTSKYVQRPWNVLKSLAGTFEIWIVAWVREDEKEYHVNLEDGWYFYNRWWRYQYIRFSCRSSTRLSLSRRSGLFRESNILDGGFCFVTVYTFANFNPRASMCWGLNIGSEATADPCLCLLQTTIQASWSRFKSRSPICWPRKGNKIKKITSN